MNKKISVNFIISSNKNLFLVHFNFLKSMEITIISASLLHYKKKYIHLGFKIKDYTIK